MILQDVPNLPPIMIINETIAVSQILVIGMLRYVLRTSNDYEIILNEYSDVRLIWSHGACLAPRARIFRCVRRRQGVRLLIIFI